MVHLHCHIVQPTAATPLAVEQHLNRHMMELHILHVVGELEVHLKHHWDALLSAYHSYMCC